jgi:gas vesicle protein
MKRLLKFLFGAAVGAAAVVLVTPKTGREWREQLLGDRARGLLTSGSDEFLETPAPDWQAESSVEVAEPLETPVAEGEDLRARIEATKVAIENEIAQPFQTAPQAVEDTAPAIEVEEPQVGAEPTVAEVPAADEAPVVDEAPAVEEAPVAEESPITEEAVEEPVAETDPVIEEPAVIAEPVIEEPALEAEPVVDVAPELLEAPQAHVEEALPEEPVAESEPVTEETAEEAEAEPVVEEPVVEAPVAEEGAEPISPRIGERETWLAEAAPQAVETDEEPVADVYPAAEETAIEEPVAEETVVDEAAVDEPVAEVEPAAEAPAADEPAGDAAIDQAEMRRRIEETRARLKAKAFDAMMSGEAALLSRDSGEKPVPREAEIKVDDELEDKLDESLSPEDY